MKPILYDISPTLEPEIAVWPGDRPFSRNEELRLRDGAAVNLSSVCLSLHTGAHADAPCHVDDAGASIDQVPLDAYLGRARLVRFGLQRRIELADVQRVLAQPSERLLFSCNPEIDPEHFPESFVHLSPEAAEAIGRAGVRLIGVDAPSVDAPDSAELPVHHILGRHGVAILENLRLDGIAEGEYEIVALPLKIRGGDGSPVRAVLRTIACQE